MDRRAPRPPPLPYTTLFRSVDYGKPIRLFVTLRKKGGHMVVDWTGTNPQVKGAINNTLSFTKAASYTGVRSVLPQGIPNNEGVDRKSTRLNSSHGYRSYAVF